MTTKIDETYLNQVDAAYVIFKTRHPEFIETEALCKDIAFVLKNQGLDPRVPEHLSAAYLSLRPAPAPQPAQAQSVDPIDAAARELISSGQVSRESIAALTAEEYARASQNDAFVRADEILNPRTATPHLTRGDHVLMQAERERAHKATLTHEIVSAVEAGRREYNTSLYSSEPEPAPGVGYHANPLGRGTTVVRRGAQTPEEARANEAENARRQRFPEKTRGEFAREAQEQRTREHNERWSR